MNDVKGLKTVSLLNILILKQIVLLLVYGTFYGYQTQNESILLQAVCLCFAPVASGLRMTVVWQYISL